MTRFLSKTTSILLLALCLLTGIAHATDDRLTVRNVAVDVNADSSAAARDQALIAGQRQAFEQLWNAQAPDKPVPKLSDDQIGDMVRDFSVQNEKSSGTRYVATLTYRFRAGPTDRVLAKGGVTLAAPAEKKENVFVTTTTTATNSVTAPVSSAQPLTNPNMAVSAMNGNRPIFVRVAIGSLNNLQQVQTKLGSQAQLLSLTRLFAVWRVSAVPYGVALQPSQQPVWWEGQWQPTYQAVMR